ncbi:MAG: hypothetical protein A2284_11115 [Deltaproteobacteria bacterium RIFOXYA12_FULL_61_11]|nr:MAG: hypothetical protein A2284_11115 [Deltaproteobacteria bacterium RIFOXYA12_FULL_61_11]
MVKPGILLLPILGTVLIGCGERAWNDVEGDWSVSSLTVNLPVLEQWFGFSTSLTEYHTSGQVIQTKLKGTMDLHGGRYSYDLNYTLQANIYGILPLNYDEHHHDSGTYALQGNLMTLTSTAAERDAILPRYLYFKIKATKLAGSSLVLEEYPTVPQKDDWFVRMGLSDGGGM